MDHGTPGVSPRTAPVYCRQKGRFAILCESCSLIAPNSQSFHINTFMEFFWTPTQSMLLNTSNPEELLELERGCRSFNITIQ